MNFLKRPTVLDVAVLTLFTVFITLHPYYLHGNINLFELGIYLPGINSILDGSIPYRDFFHLRGPFELYMPALFMSFFGENVAVLMSYFYLGTIITLFMCILLSRQLLSTRLFFYLAMFVLIARTFPRVVFTYWGGMRFALGLMAIACAVQYFKNNKPSWLFLSGLIAACSFWTSLEIGAYVCIAVLVTLFLCILSKNLRVSEGAKLFAIFLGGFLAISLPYSIYLHLNDALIPFFNTITTIAFNMEKTFPQVEAVPKNFVEAVFATLNPNSKNFKHLTPVYLYLFITIYIINRFKTKKFSFPDFSIVCLAVYGFVFFIGSFRNIWSSNFEMVLQPEKILLFVLLERIFFFARGRRDLICKEIQKLDTPVFKKRIKVWAINIFIGGVILSSIGYPIQRYNKRFFAFKFIRNSITGKEKRSLKPLYDVEKKKMGLKRVRGLIVPMAQALDFIMLDQYISSHTSSQDPVLMYPEGAAYSFIIDRPFVGRFPMANFSWFNEDDHQEYLVSLAKARAEYAVVPKELPHYFEKTHFIVKRNKEKYDEVMRFINNNYKIVKTTPTLNILKWREDNGQ